MEKAILTKRFQEEIKSIQVKIKELEDDKSLIKNKTTRDLIQNRLDFLYEELETTQQQLSRFDKLET